MSNWGSPWASERLGSGASLGEVLCPVACWEVSGHWATETWTLVGCEPYVGVVTFHHGLQEMVWYDDSNLGEEDKRDDEAVLDSALLLAGNVVLGRLGSHGLPFRLEIPPRHRGWGSLRAEAVPDLP